MYLLASRQCLFHPVFIHMGRIYTVCLLFVENTVQSRKKHAHNNALVLHGLTWVDQIAWFYNVTQRSTTLTFLFCPLVSWNPIKCFHYVRWCCPSTTLSPFKPSFPFPFPLYFLSVAPIFVPCLILYFYIIYNIVVTVIKYTHTLYSPTTYPGGKMNVDLESLAEATSGAIGSLISTTILYPLDTCKTKYQADARSHGRTRYRFFYPYPFFFLFSSYR